MLQWINLTVVSKSYKTNLVSVSLPYCSVRNCFKNSKLKEYSRCFKVLEIPDESDQETVRKAFITMCKKYHPDSGKTSADALKFQEVEAAYRTLQNKFAEERWNVNEGIGEYGLYYEERKNEESSEKPEVFDIKHTAPQHRQYLSYEGIGFGTPTQRQKQYVKHRTTVAAQNVLDHHVKKLSQRDVGSTLVTKDKTEAVKIKTRSGMDRLVEDLIQESMAKGHFHNLKGQGKPLPSSRYNPYVDFVTHKMNEILIDNGFAPEWITLQKHIGKEIESLKEILVKERKKLGSVPLNMYEEQKWNKVVESLKERVCKLNQDINKFNLVVPMMERQKLYFNLEKVSCDILENGVCNSPPKVSERTECGEKEKKDHIFNALETILPGDKLLSFSNHEED